MNLGADYCAEHEWGIKGLHASFGIPFGDDEKLGLEKRTITIVPSSPDFCLEAHPKKFVLYFQDASWMGVEATAKQQASIKANTTRGELYLYGDKTLATAWDDKSFGVHTTSKEGISALAQVYDAFQRKDAAIWLGGGGVFQNAGLVLAITSRVPKDKADGMRAADEDRVRLVAAAKATGIEDRLREAGRKWFALSPGWKFDKYGGSDRPITTAHPVMFYLNPQEQRIHASGWFTVEDLEQWAEGKGPVMSVRPGRR